MKKVKIRKQYLIKYHYHTDTTIRIGYDFGENACIALQNFFEIYNYRILVININQI